MLRTRVHYGFYPCLSLSGDYLAYAKIWVGPRLVQKGLAEFLIQNCASHLALVHRTERVRENERCGGLCAPPAFTKVSRKVQTFPVESVAESEPHLIPSQTPWKLKWVQIGPILDSSPRWTDVRRRTSYSLIFHFKKIIALLPSFQAKIFITGIRWSCYCLLWNFNLLCFETWSLNYS